MASEELNNLRKPSARRSKPDMAALVDQQRLFENPWSRKPLFQLESLVPVVSLHDVGSHPSSIERVDMTSTSLAEKRFLKHPSHSVKSVKDGDNMTVERGSLYVYSFNKLEANKIHGQASFSSSDDSDIMENNNINSVDEDDDLPLSTFLPLKSDTLTNNTTIITNHHYHNNNTNNSIHDEKNFIPFCPCTKPAVLDDPRLDGLFCSPECLIRACHEAFDVWLRNHHCIKNNSII
ncbi:unnamed protein product [Schistosoma intercalatum]|nr:unnamed protein product [Schistosoma intercalatum]CAH8593488.1 unnamed protein product [Schistosoma intercalatum]